jgi:hypothetical protein
MGTSITTNACDKYVQISHINIMSIKLVSFATSALLLIVGFPKLVNSAPTTWDNVESSMTQLLNSGWQIIAQAVHRTTVVAPGNYLDTTIFTYTLSKGGKYITCIVQDPKPPIANKSGCRRLN